MIMSTDVLIGNKIIVNRLLFFPNCHVHTEMIKQNVTRHILSMAKCNIFFFKCNIFIQKRNWENLSNTDLEKVSSTYIFI